MRPLAAFAVVLLLVGVVRAQEATSAAQRSRLVAETAEQLRSAKPEVCAWGAYRVSKHGLKENIPLIVGALRALEGKAARTPLLELRAALLDALVRTDAEVASKDLAPHLDWLSSPAIMVLVGRRPRDHLDLLRSILAEPEPHSDLVVRAAGNLLVRENPPGLAASLLSCLRIEATVVVREGPGPHRDCVGICPGDGLLPRPEGHPPLVIYRLDDKPPTEWPSYLDLPASHRLVAGGPRPIYGWRREGNVHAFSDSGTDPIPTGVRIAEWIADLLRDIGAEPAANDVRRHRFWRQIPIRVAADLGPPARPRIEFRYAGTPPLLRQTKKEHAAIAATFWETVRSLLEAGLLTRDEAGCLSPSIRIVYEDKRRDRRTPLPEPPRPATRNPFETCERKSSPYRIR